MQETPDSVVEATPIRPGPHPALAAAASLNVAVVIVAALYLGRELLMPLVVAALLAFVLAPACALLMRARLPRVLAVGVVVLVTFAVLGGIGAVAGRQVRVLAGNLPSYETTVQTKWQALASDATPLGRLLARNSGAIGKDTAGPLPAPVRPGLPTGLTGGLGDGLPAGLRGPGLSLARTLAEPLLGSFATAGIVLVFTIFILLSNEDLRDRIVRLMGRRDLHRTILAMNDAARRLSRYFLFQLGLNTGFGTAIALSLWLAGLPNPLLWGVLAALMRFVPFIGVFIALVPPLLLALAVVPGWSLAITVLVLFVAGELVMGQVVEPLIYGHSTGLSPIAVIVATAFWALLWGPVGLLLATPLTVCLVVVGRHVEALAFLDVILGDTPPLEPAETFYQRSLEGKGRALADDARRRIAATSRSEYYDAVALPGLAMAQGDLARDALAFERLEAIHVQIAALLARLDHPSAASATQSIAQAGSELTGPPRSRAPASMARGLASHPAPAWASQGAILCIPGRGQLDDLAATMAVQVLHEAGFGASLESNLVLGASGAGLGSLAGARLCCLSVLEQGSTASGIRYYVRRIRRTMPDAAVVVCLWHAASDSPLLAALRSDGQEERLVLSIGELLALTQVLANRQPARTPEPDPSQQAALPGSPQPAA